MYSRKCLKALGCESDDLQGIGEDEDIVEVDHYKISVMSLRCDS